MKNLFARLAKATKKPTQLNSPRNSTSVFFARTLFFTNKNILTSQHKALIVLLLCWIGFAVTAQTTNLLFKERPEQPFSLTKPAILQDHIIYATENEQNSIVYSYHLTSRDHSPLFQGTLYSPFSVLDNRAYFMVENDSEYQQWETDGTVAGTQPIGSPTVIPGIAESNDLLFSYSNEGKLISSDGSEFVEHDIELANLNSICAFSVNDVIAYSDSTSDSESPTALLRSQNGLVSSLSEGFQEFFTFLSDSIVRVEDACYMLVRNAYDNSRNELLYIPQEGPTLRLSDQLNVDGIYDVFTYKNRLHAILQSDTGEFSVNRLNPAMTQYDASFMLPEDVQFVQASTSSDYIILTTNTFFLGTREIIVLDQDFNEIPDLEGLYLTFPPAVYPTAQGDLFFSRTSVNGVSGARTLSYSINQTSGTTSIYSYFVSIVSTSKSSNDVILMLRDKTTSQQSIHVLSDTPNIGPILTGSWFDPNIENQGLNIIVGTRANGSQYVNLTGYTYRDGLPLWFAGNDDVSPPQDSIDIEVYEFSGIGMFEADVTPNRDVLGTVNLALTGCNSLNANIDIEGTSFQLSLLRIDDKTNTADCTD